MNRQKIANEAASYRIFLYFRVNYRRDRMTRVSIIIAFLFSVQCISAQLESKDTLLAPTDSMTESRTEIKTESTTDSTTLALANDSLNSREAAVTDSLSPALEDTTKKKNFFVKIKESKFGDFVRECHWGAMGGLGCATIHFDKKDIYQHYVCNVRLGITADYYLDSLLKNLFVESGLEFQRKGYQRHYEAASVSATTHTEFKAKTNLYYLTIPATAGYRFHFQGFEFTPMIGPYYALAVGGRYKQTDIDTEDGEEKVSEKKYSMFEKDSKNLTEYQARRFDIGLRIAVGIEYFKGMRSSVGYDWGFFNVLKNYREEVVKSRHGSFYVSHTYFFH